MSRARSDLDKALLYEADVILAQSQDVKALGKGRREALAGVAWRLRQLAQDAPYPYIRYGDRIRAAGRGPSSPSGSGHGDT